MLMIRFQRIGRKNDPAFRIAVLEKTSGPKAGKYVDLVGTYNPKTKATTLKPELIKSWKEKGAQVSPSVMNLLIKQGVFEGKLTPAVSKKNLEKNKAKNEEAAAKAAEAAIAAANAAAEAAAAAKAEAEKPAEVAVETAPEETPVTEEAAVEVAPEEVAAEEVPAAE